MRRLALAFVLTILANTLVSCRFDTLVEPLGAGRNDARAVREPATPPAPTENPSRELVAYYPLNGNGHDASGANGHADVQGPVAVSDRNGERCGAMMFDGASSCLVVSSAVRCAPITRQIRISVWVHPMTRKTQSVVRAGGAPNAAWEIAFSETGDLIFRINNGAHSEIRIAGYDLNRWMHLDASYDGRLMRLKVDGRVVGTHETSGAMNDTGNPILIGTRMRLPADTFHGMIDDLKIYDRAQIEEV